MKLEVASSPARGAWSRRIAFLHEAADPGKGGPAAVRAELSRACRSAGFRGLERETAGEGGWTLVGLGPAPTPLSKLRRVVRRSLKDALRHAAGRVLVAFDAGVDV